MLPSVNGNYSDSQCRGISREKSVVWAYPPFDFKVRLQGAPSGLGGDILDRIDEICKEAARYN